MKFGEVLRRPETRRAPADGLCESLKAFGRGERVSGCGGGGRRRAPAAAGAEGSGVPGGGPPREGRPGGGGASRPLPRLSMVVAASQTPPWLRGRG